MFTRSNSEQDENMTKENAKIQVLENEIEQDASWALTGFLSSPIGLRSLFLFSVTNLYGIWCFRVPNKDLYLIGFYPTNATDPRKALLESSFKEAQFCRCHNTPSVYLFVFWGAEKGSRDTAEAIYKLSIRFVFKVLCFCNEIFLAPGQRRV